MNISVALRKKDTKQETDNLVVLIKHNNALASPIQALVELESALEKCKSILSF
jgi:hypothetical protein